MRFDALLRAHAYMRAERPPEIWEVDTEDLCFLPLLGEMIAAALSKGTPLGELTLNGSNVVVEASEDPDDTPEVPAPAEYVAVTVSGQTDFGPDVTWHPSKRDLSGLLFDLQSRLVVTHARYAYIRRVPPEGSFTVFIPRLIAVRQNPRGDQAP